MKTAFLILAILSILPECKRHRQGNCTITSDDLLIHNPNRVFGTESENGIITEYRDKARDSLLAGYYSFFGNGHLKSYYFFTDLKYYTYEEKYDSLGNLISKTGSPFIFCSINRINNDSFSVKTYFFSIRKIYQPLMVTVNDAEMLHVDLKYGSLFSYTKAGLFGLKLNGRKLMNLIFRAQYQDECTHDDVISNDTLQLKLNAENKLIRMDVPMR